MLNESFIGSVISSVFAVISSEIGDKTFFVAVLLSTAATDDGPSKTAIFTGAMIANAALHSAAVLLGSVSAVIPRAILCWSSTFLVGVYGMKMLRDGFWMSPDKTLREYKEAEHEVKELEKSKDSCGGDGSMVKYLNSSYFFKSFCLTFISEWGDRSQISALLMTTNREASAVLFGGILGHVLCLLVAVVGGSYVGPLVSVRVMTICGGFLFLVLALNSAYDIYAGDHE